VGLDDGFSLYGNSVPNTGHASIAGFSILSDGTLQATPGSPYAGPAAALASNGAALTLYAASGPTLDVNRINGDGSLTTTATLNSQPLTPSIGFYEHLAFNAPAQMLYASTAHGAGDNFWEIYNTGGDGSLTANGSKQDNLFMGALSFVSGGQRAYQPYCYHFDGNIFGYNVGANGQLAFFDSKAPIPSIGGLSSCPFALAVSPDGKYVAAAINPKMDSSTGSTLGIFSVNSDGTLSATTGSPFPRTDVGRDIEWDSSGHFIAVAEKDGLWVYSFTAGTAPVPVGGAPIVTGAIDHLAFNRAGTLLFAISSATENVYAFSCNSGSGTVTPAAGSPHKMDLVPYQLTVAER